MLEILGALLLTAILLAFPTGRFVLGCAVLFVAVAYVFTL